MSKEGTLLVTTEESLRGLRFYVDALGTIDAAAHSFDDFRYDFDNAVWTKGAGSMEEYQQLVSRDGNILALDLTTDDGQVHRVYLLALFGGQHYGYPPDENGVLMRDPAGYTGREGSDVVGDLVDEFGTGAVVAIYQPGRPWH